MRPIKFRAWDKLSKTMSAPMSMIDIAKGNLPLSYSVDGQADDRYSVLMQYTGLKDKNGTEIYEGDVVKTFNKYIGSVEFGEQDIGHDFQGIGFYVNEGYGADNIYGGQNIEVIGNIYENPELLGGTE